MKKTVRDVEVKGKKVIVRCDFNVPELVTVFYCFKYFYNFLYAVNCKKFEVLHVEDFKRIFLEFKNALTKQYAELLETEGVKIEFLDEAIDRMSFLAADVNSKNENIGARRLHTIMEMLLEDSLLIDPVK